MTFPCIAAARRFDPAAHLRFEIAGRQVGWVRRADVAKLARWPDVFELSDARVVLSARYDTVDARSMALASAIGALAAEGAIPGWRDEIYAIRNRFDDPPLAYIERAAARFFGTQTYAVHLNGIVEYAAAPGAPAVPQMWLGRRSATKATDPGMLDNVVAGGIGWGLGVRETLAKECWEEAGMPAELAARAVAGRAVQVLWLAARRHAIRTDLRVRPAAAARLRAAQPGRRGGRASAGRRSGSARLAARRPRDDGCEPRDARHAAAPPLAGSGRRRRMDALFAPPA